MKSNKNIFNFQFSIFNSLILAAILSFYACGEDDDVKLPDITVNFSTDKMGIEPSAESANATLNLSRATNTVVEVKLNYTATGVAYETGFTTDPVPSGNEITVTIPAGQTSASVKVTKKDDLYDGTENIVFSIVSINSSAVIGDTKELTLTFGAIVSDGSTMTLQGRVGDVATANSAYVDFSQNTQNAVDRKSWTLGFYCGDKFRVFLNPAIQMAAGATSKTDINAVTVADAADVPRLVANMMAGQMISLQNVDDLAGDINKTAFAEISANAADNKVYLVAFEGNNTKPEDYYKVKVTRKDNGYSVQYGKLGGGEIKTADVTKDAAYNMVCLSFTDNKITTPEPKKWDIQWSYSTGLTQANGVDVAYFMQDYVSLNTIGGTQAIEVLTSTISYENFSASNLPGLNFSTARNLIGSEWRRTANMNGESLPLGVKTDRFYVIKDADGNYYKLKFTKMGLNDSNPESLRGLPVIEYKLVK